MRIILVMLVGTLWATDFPLLEKESLLYRSAHWINEYRPQLARAASPPLFPQTDSGLSQAAIWLTIEPEFLGPFPLAELTKRERWHQFQNLGVQAIETHAIRQINGDRDYETVVRLAGMYDISLIGIPLTPLTSEGPDFQLALSNYKDYAQLFHLIELDMSDWNLPVGTLSMAQVQQLKKSGILAGRPEEIYPYLKTSCWEASPLIVGSDGKKRRWVFLRWNNLPALDWLNPSFLSEKLAGGEVTHALLKLSQSFLIFDATVRGDALVPTKNALNTLSLLTRKIKGFSALRLTASLAIIREIQTDFIYDRFTPIPLLHALITEDAEALRIIYRTFLDTNFSSQRFIHDLHSTHFALCEWGIFLENPKLYNFEEKITGELLAERLLHDDVLRLNWTPSEYAPPKAPLFGLCPEEPLDYRTNREQLQQARLLIAFFYAMQNGAFSFSTRDLPGSLLAELNNRNSFAGKLKTFFSIRSQQQMERAELIDVLPVENRSLLLLLHRLPNELFAITAVNFSRSPQKEQIAHPLLGNRWVVELLSGMADPKSFSSTNLDLQLGALSGKIYLLQTKSFDGI